MIGKKGIWEAKLNHIGGGSRKVFGRYFRVATSEGKLMYLYYKDRKGMDCTVGISFCKSIEFYPKDIEGEN